MCNYRAAALFVLSGALTVASTIPGAQAGQCPSGQILRVSLNKCAPRSENLQFLQNGGRHGAVSQAKGRDASVRAALHASLKPSVDETTLTAETTVAPRTPGDDEQKPSTLASAGGATSLTAYIPSGSPFGGLPQWTPSR